MEDPVARDGTLARCNQHREETLHDIECANARRAASAVALQEERDRRRILEVLSEEKIAALRAELERERQHAQDLRDAAQAAAQAAYEALWNSIVDGRGESEETVPGAAGDGEPPAPPADP